jgi:hypothetical protein
MNETMEIIKVQQKGKHLNTLENFHIYNLYQQGIQLNNNCSNFHNPIFKEVQNISRQFALHKFTWHLLPVLMFLYKQIPYPFPLPITKHPLLLPILSCHSHYIATHYYTQFSLSQCTNCWSLEDHSVSTHQHYKSQQLHEQIRNSTILID